MKKQPALRAAFLHTTYGLRSERFTLAENPTKRAKLPSWATAGQSWAIVTAWNPAGEQAPAQDNHERQIQLRALVVERQWPFLEGVSGAGEWQEETLIVLGARLKDALAWGRSSGQAAVLYGCGARVALVWLSPLRAERFWVRASKA